MKKLNYSLMILMLLLSVTAVLADDTHEVVIEENHECYPDGATNIKAYVTPYPTDSDSDFACCSRYYLRMYIDGDYKGWDEYHANWYRWDNLEFSWSGTLTEGEHTIRAEWGIYNIYASNPFYPPIGSQEIPIVIQPCITVIDSNVKLIQIL